MNTVQILVEGYSEILPRNVVESLIPEMCVDSHSAYEKLQAACEVYNVSPELLDRTIRRIARRLGGLDDPR